MDVHLSSLIFANVLEVGQLLALAVIAVRAGRLLQQVDQHDRRIARLETVKEAA